MFPIVAFAHLGEVCANALCLTRQREHALRSGGEFETEHWLTRASSRIAPMKDAASNVVKWFGTATDSDSEEQKQAKANAESASRASALDLALASGMKKSAGNP